MIPAVPQGLGEIHLHAFGHAQRAGNIAMRPSITSAHQRQSRSRFGLSLGRVPLKIAELVAIDRIELRRRQRGPPARLRAGISSLIQRGMSAAPAQRDLMACCRRRGG